MILNFTVVLLIFYCIVELKNINSKVEYSLFYTGKPINWNLDSSFNILKVSTSENNNNSSYSKNDYDLEKDNLMEWFVRKAAFLNNNPNLPGGVREGLLSEIANRIYILHRDGEDVSKIELSKLLKSQKDFELIQKELISNNCELLQDHRDFLPKEELTITPPKPGGGGGGSLIFGWVPEPGTKYLDVSKNNSTLFERFLFSVLSFVSSVAEFILEFIENFNNLL